MTYSSGIEPALDALGMAPYQSPASLDAFIEAYGSGPLVHTPGSRSVYGNTEYILLHQLIETVSQRSYEAVLEEVIVRPAGLTDTQLITAYGLWGSTGWGTFSEPFYYRTGGIQGSTANWIRTMETGKTILVLSNTNATNLFELSEALYLVGR